MTFKRTMGLVLVLTLVLGLFGSGLWINHAHAEEAQPALHTLTSIPEGDIIPADSYVNKDADAPASLKYYLTAKLNGTDYYYNGKGTLSQEYGIVAAESKDGATAVTLAQGVTTGTYRIIFWNASSAAATNYMCFYIDGSYTAGGRTRLSDTTATRLKDLTLNADGTFAVTNSNGTEMVLVCYVGKGTVYTGVVAKATVEAAEAGTYAYVYLAGACTAGTEAFDNGDGNHYYKCTSCNGKVGMTACTAGTELKHGDAAVETDDQANHWNTCTECGAVVASTKVAHNYGDWTNNGTEQTRTCGDCGYVQKAAVHTCEAAEDAQWQTTDANQHYKLCKDCGQPVESTKADHEWTVTKIDGNAEKHAAKCACGAEKEVAHTFGEWKVVKAPATFSDKGTDKRTCADCGFEETKTTTLAVEDVVKATSAPTPGVPFFLGATQLQTENQATYFFKGSWAPSTYQNMDRTTKIEGAAPMYSEAVSGGYKLYFYNAEGAKTYLVIAEMEVSGSTKVFVQPVTSAADASVFTWNDEHDTFVTTVEGKGEYYIGNYTNNGTAYTALSALQAGGLGRDDRHAVHPYVAKGVLDSAKTGDNTMISVAVAAMVISLSAVAVLTVGKKKHI